MIVDLAEEDPPGRPEYDLVVVGTGPAGAVLANELADSGLAIAVLESGRRRPSARADALRELECEGIAIKEWSRERVLGGASTTWAGLSSPLDPLDLAPRPWIGSEGWPIEAAELERLWEEAAARYGFPARAAYGPEGFARLRARGAWQPRWKQLAEKVFLARAEPQDFGRACAAAWAAPNVHLLLDATVVRLECGGARDGEFARVRQAVVRTSRGELRVRARAFALAAGGIENARLLLVSTDAAPEGLGNQRDQVGRGFMNHPKNYFGTVRLAQPVLEAPYWFGALDRGFAGYAGLRLDDDAQRDLGLVNAYARFEPLFPWSDDSGVDSFVAFVKRSRGLFTRWKRARAGDVVELRSWAETGDDSESQNRRRGRLGALALLGNATLHAPSVARYAWHRLGRRKPKIVRARVRNFLEMQPRAQNRVTLSTRRDAHGVPLAHVAHQVGELDRRSLVELHRVLRGELSANGIGELEGELERADPWPIDQDASHHMGATRMGRAAASSVVDPTLRLHGASNVWLAGASVFPTSGSANPTATIVALSIRLARELRTALATNPALASRAETRA